MTIRIDAPETSIGANRPLSPRELQVAILTAEGLRTEDLARSLGIGEGTVKSVKQGIRRKLGLARGARLPEELRGLCGPRLPVLAAEAATSDVGVVDETGSEDRPQRPSDQPLRPPRSSGSADTDPPDSDRGGDVPAEPAQDFAERRVHLTLRQAIYAVQELGSRLEARSAAMREAAERSPAIRHHLLWEAEQLEALSISLDRLRSGSIARARARASASVAS
ncbi:MAG TPA: helix-turn-helix transcriptional regulator [Candidatus Dormibacteraeota bacterium]|nr:helix-turn-helix transcriptional regulator [Candidatus Dormibacteraeota bacterium]